MTTMADSISRSRSAMWLAAPARWRGGPPGGVFYAGRPDGFAIGKKPGGRGAGFAHVVDDAPVEEQEHPDDIDREKNGFHSGTQVCEQGASIGLKRRSYTMVEFNIFATKKGLLSRGFADTACRAASGRYEPGGSIDESYRLGHRSIIERLNFLYKYQ
ncbi:MAG: hypothetical protein ACFCUT_13005 [Kiloniellaceae bacterium]